jgi:hypothetical protein
MGPYGENSINHEDGQSKDDKTKEAPVFPAAKHRGAEGDKGAQDQDTLHVFHTTSRVFGYLIDAATARMLPTTLLYVICRERASANSR